MLVHDQSSRPPSHGHRAWAAPFEGGRVGCLDVNRPKTIDGAENLALIHQVTATLEFQDMEWKPDAQASARSSGWPCFACRSSLSRRRIPPTRPLPEFGLALAPVAAAGACCWPQGATVRIAAKPSGRGSGPVGRYCDTPACQPAASPEPQHTAAPVPRSAKDRARAARGSAGPSECVSPARQAGPLHPMPGGARRQSVHALLFADGKRDVQSSPAQARTKAQREQEGPGLDEVDD